MNYILIKINNKLLKYINVIFINIFKIYIINAIFIYL